MMCWVDPSARDGTPHPGTRTGIGQRERLWPELDTGHRAPDADLTTRRSNWKRGARWEHARTTSPRRRRATTSRCSGVRTRTAARSDDHDKYRSMRGTSRRSRRSFRGTEHGNGINGLRNTPSPPDEPNAQERFRTRTGFQRHAFDLRLRNFFDSSARSLLSGTWEPPTVPIESTVGALPSMGAWERSRRFVPSTPTKGSRCVRYLTTSALRRRRVVLRLPDGSHRLKCRLPRRILQEQVSDVRSEKLASQQNGGAVGNTFSPTADTVFPAQVTPATRLRASRHTARTSDRTVSGRRHYRQHRLDSRRPLEARPHLPSGHQPIDAAKRS